MWGVGTNNRLTAVCVSIDRFLQNTAPNRCLPFDPVGTPASRHWQLFVQWPQAGREPGSLVQFSVCRIVNSCHRFFVSIGCCPGLWPASRHDARCRSQVRIRPQFVVCLLIVSEPVTPASARSCSELGGSTARVSPSPFGQHCLQSCGSC